MRIDWNKYEVAMRPDTPADEVFLDRIATRQASLVVAAHRDDDKSGGALHLSWQTRPGRKACLAALGVELLCDGSGTALERDDAAALHSFLQWRKIHDEEPVVEGFDEGRWLVSAKGTEEYSIHDMNRLLLRGAVLIERLVTALALTKTPKKEGE